MNARAIPALICSLILVSLAACGGGDRVAFTASAPTPVAMAQPLASPAPMPVASNCNDPSCLGGADALADQYRTGSIERAAVADAASPPAYPNVPSNAITVPEARAPEASGSALATRAR